MITIKTGGYTPFELQLLHTLFQQIHADTTVCNICFENKCETCEIRHLCGDIVRAKEHTKRLAEQTKTHPNK